MGSLAALAALLENLGVRELELHVQRYAQNCMQHAQPLSRLSAVLQM